MSDARPGTVYLVGSGPGDPGLVSQRALQLVRSADLLLLDRLGPRSLADEAPDDAERIDVGKTAGNHAMPQEQINETLVRAARAGRRVVRVKGGDPYLFGRGGEEALACRAAGVPFEVVPAVTSAFAACAAAGIPVTHRDLARDVTVVTASAGRDGQGDPDYAWLAASRGTIVLLMGLRRVAHVAEQLLAHGAPPTRPVAVVSRGTTSEQRTVSATLATIADAVADARLASPAIIVVGDVVSLRPQLDWFETRPLFGMRVGVTRARAQASSLVDLLAEQGAQVVEVSTIRVEAVDPAAIDASIDRCGATDLVAFTSVNGVERWFARLEARNLDARVLGTCRVAVVGSASAAACRAHGIVADIMPPAGARTSAGLLQHLLERDPVQDMRIDIVRAEAGDDTLIDGLVAAGASAQLVPAYRTVQTTGTPAQADALASCDVITLTSASTARAAHELLAGRNLPPCISIGPTTTAAARERGLTVAAQAAEPSIAAVLQATIEHRAASMHAAQGSA